MKKLKLIAAMSCIWASSHALALEPPATLTQVNPSISAVDIAGLNLNAEDTAILQSLPFADRNNTAGGAVPIWDRLTPNQKTSFIVAVSSYFVVSNTANVVITSLRHGTDNDYKRKAIITNVCNGLPVVSFSRLLSSYQIGVARADALERGVPSVNLNRNQIAAMVGYSSGLFLFSSVCTLGAEIVYPSGRRLQNADEAEILLNVWIENAFDLKRRWQAQAQDYYLYPGSANIEAQRKINLSIQLSQLYSDKFSAMYDKMNDIEGSMRLISSQEDFYQACQAFRARDPGCSVATAKNKADTIAELNSQLGRFKLLTQEAYEIQKDLLDLFGINTNYPKKNTERYVLGFEIQ